MKLLFDFLDESLEKLVHHYFDNLPNRVLTRKEFKEYLSNYDLSYEVYKYEQYLLDNNEENTEIYDDEVTVLGRRFYEAVMDKFMY